MHSTLKFQMPRINKTITISTNFNVKQFLSPCNSSREVKKARDELNGLKLLSILLLILSISISNKAFVERVLGQ